MSAPARSDLSARFQDTRRRTVDLIDGLSEADVTVQSMTDASPAKWHLAHTTWFFETLVLAHHLPAYRLFDARFTYLFNSYYETVGSRHPRPQRGMLTRPDLATVLRYREYVDEAMARLFAGMTVPAGTGTVRTEPEQSLPALIELGVQHEQQHQELLLTDLLHLFSLNPLAPAYRPMPDGSRAIMAGTTTAPTHEAARPSTASPGPARFVSFEGGRYAVGHDGSGFAYDCEMPVHEVWLRPFALADRPVTNGEWRAFIDDGGYREPLLWLSDGWARVCAEGWQAPLYWRSGEGADGSRAGPAGGTARSGPWMAMTLHGECVLDDAAPVAHISYYEADAFARWAGRRLPTEFEWEVAARIWLRERAARQTPATDGDPGQQAFVDGHFADDGLHVPAAASSEGLRQLAGDVWEWTSSAFAPYPGFHTVPGAAGEYNGKFMCGQYVLRGGSCATPRGHARATYRNFFPPWARWQFSGLRLAGDPA